MAFDERAQPLKVAERWRPHAEAVRSGRLAVADDEVPELAFRRFDRVVRLPRRRLDEARHFADDRTLGQPLGRLADDAQRLAELLEPDEIPIVGVARGADGHV